jgi:hypothetical protein
MLSFFILYFFNFYFNIDYIKNETLAVELSFKETLINAQEVEFDNINIKIKIKKI